MYGMLESSVERLSLSWSIRMSSMDIQPLIMRKRIRIAYTKQSITNGLCLITQAICAEVCATKMLHLMPNSMNGSGVANTNQNKTMYVHNTEALYM